MHYLKFTTTVRYKKSKAIALNSAEIKIVRTEVKNPICGVFPSGYQLRDRTISSTSDVELSATDGRSRIGSNKSALSDHFSSAISLSLGAGHVVDALFSSFLSLCNMFSLPESNSRDVLDSNPCKKPILLLHSLNPITTKC